MPQPGSADHLPSGTHPRAGTPGTEIEPFDRKPPPPKAGPRHRAPRPARRWRGKVLTLTVAGVAVGGVVMTLSHHDSGHVARASADSSQADGSQAGASQAGGPPTRPLIGPGCGTKPESSAFPAMVGDGWTDIGGGPAQCGGHSLASQTTSTTTAVQDTYTWSFQTAKSARCTARVFVSSADPSPGLAHYDVSRADQPLASFTIDQARFKGQWVAAGPFTTFDGKLQIKLTDQPERAGAQHHVNASAATIGCVS
jgi:hypothetical protein